MSHVSHFNTNVALRKMPNGQTQVGMNYGPQQLVNLGYNIFVEVSTASAFVNGPQGQTKNSIAVMAHFDTGATKTSIDATLAQHLGLISTGNSRSHTAAGPQITPDYAIDISFIGTTLKQILNLRVGSCNLGFNLANAQQTPNNPRNMGLLIGRDIMSLWSITWHGPTSTVLISD